MQLRQGFGIGHCMHDHTWHLVIGVMGFTLKDSLEGPMYSLKLGTEPRYSSLTVLSVHGTSSGNEPGNL